MSCLNRKGVPTLRADTISDLAFRTILCLAMQYITYAVPKAARYIRTRIRRRPSCLLRSYYGRSFPDKRHLPRHKEGSLRATRRASFTCPPLDQGALEGCHSQERCIAAKHAARHSMDPLVMQKKTAYGPKFRCLRLTPSSSKDFDDE